MCEFVRLGDHIAIAKGKPPAELPFDGPGASLYLTPEYLRGRAAAQPAKPADDAVAVADGDAVLLWDGSNAGEFFPGRAGLAASTMARIRADESIDRGYLVHALKHIEPRLKSQTSGTGIPHVDREVLEGFQVFRPCEPEQVRVAEVLDTLDTTIRQTEAVIEKLKQVKQGLLHDLLTRGIDANGELRPPQSQAPHIYKDSPLGWIPKEWEAVPTIAHCSLITKGTTPAAQDMWQGDDGVRFLRVDNLSFDGHFDFEASKFRVSPATHSGTLARSRCLPGDVLTNIVGPPLGKLGLVTDQCGEININQAIALFRPTGQLLPKFLLVWLGSSISQSWLRKRAKQTSGQVNLTLALCQQLPLLSLSLAEQRAIVGRIEAAQELITLESGELVKLGALKSGLMDDLLTGRVRVTPLLDTTAPT
jgi:type I restriction enzyme S subunit